MNSPSSTLDLKEAVTYLLRDDPLLSQSSERNLTCAPPQDTSSHDFYFAPNITPMSFDMLKVNNDEGDGPSELMPIGELQDAEDSVLDLEQLISDGISDDNGPPLIVSVVNIEQLTPGGAWQDQSFLQSADRITPSMPVDGEPSISTTEEVMLSVNDGIPEALDPQTIDSNLTEGIIQSSVNSVVGFQGITSSGPPDTSSSDDLSGCHDQGVPTSSLGKTKSSRGKRKTFLHEAPNRDDPLVKRAAGAKEYREKKKQEAMQRELNLIKELDELKAKYSALQEKVSANEAVSGEDTIKIVDYIACAVKAAGGGDVIVTQRLADKHGVKMTEEVIQKIVADANLSRPGKRITFIFDLDDKGKLIAEKID